MRYKVSELKKEDLKFFSDSSQQLNKECGTDWVQFSFKNCDKNSYNWVQKQMNGFMNGKQWLNLIAFLLHNNKPSQKPYATQTSNAQEVPKSDEKVLKQG